MRRTQVIEVFPFSGGLQSANNPALVNIQNVSDINNIIFTNDATRKRRPALKQLNTITTETDNFKMLFDFWRYNASVGGQAQKVCRIINGKFEADNGGDGAFVDYTGAIVISATDVVTFDVFSGLLIMAFQNRTPLKFDHSTLAVLDGSPPQASLYRTHLGHGWLAGIPSDPHKIYRSYPDNPLVWSGAGTEQITIDDGDGDPDGVTSLFPTFNNDLYVGKRKSIHRIRQNYSSDFSTIYFTRAQVSRGVGCVSHNSVVAVQNDIIFCSERGVHSLAATDKYGDAEANFLSAPIHNIYSEQVDFSRAKDISATYSPEFQSYIVSLPLKGTSYNTDLFGYNILNGQWYRFKNINGQVVADYIDSSKSTRLMIGTSTGKVAYFDINENLDFGTDTIESFFKTGIIYPGGAKRSISFKSLTVVYVPQGNSTFTVSYSIDGRSEKTMTFNQSGGTGDNLGTPFILGTSTLGTRGRVKVESHEILGQGRGIQMSFKRIPSASDSEQGFEVLGYILEFIDSEYSDESSVQ